MVTKKSKSGGARTEKTVRVKRAKPTAKIIEADDALAEADDLPPFSPRSSQALADRLRTLIVAGEVKIYSDFAKEAGVKFGTGGNKGYYSSRLSEWYNNATEKYEKLGADNYVRLSNYVIEKFEYTKAQMGVPFVDILKEPLYHAIGPSLACERRLAASRSVKKHMAGAYRIYRTSIRHLGYYYVGILDIKFDVSTRAFVTRERYEVKRHNVIEATWDMRGALFPINKNLHMMVCVDTEDGTVQAKYIDDVGLDGDNITYLAGWLTDVEAGKYYTAPFFCDPIAKGEVAQLEFKTVRGMPQRIKDRLRAKKLSNMDAKDFTGPYAEKRELE